MKYNTNGVKKTGLTTGNEDAFQNQTYLLTNLVNAPDGEMRITLYSTNVA